MLRTLLFVLVIPIILCGSSSLPAQERPSQRSNGGNASPAQDRWTNRPLSVEGQFSPLGSPLGVLGGAVDYSPAAWASLSLGAGVGGGAYRDLQLAAMGRLRWVLDDYLGVALGGGVSRGSYAPFAFSPFSTDERVNRVWLPALWVNSEVAMEFRSPFGLAVRLFLGTSVLANRDAVKCVRGDSENVPKGPTQECEASEKSRARELLPYAGVAVGYAFHL